MKKTQLLARVIDKSGMAPAGQLDLKLPSRSRWLGGEAFRTIGTRSVCVPLPAEPSPPRLEVLAQAARLQFTPHFTSSARKFCNWIKGPPTYQKVVSGRDSPEFCLRNKPSLASLDEVQKLIDLGKFSLSSSNPRLRVWQAFIKRFKGVASSNRTFHWIEYSQGDAKCKVESLPCTIFNLVCIRTVLNEALRRYPALPEVGILERNLIHSFYSMGREYAGLQRLSFVTSAWHNVGSDLSWQNKLEARLRTSVVSHCIVYPKGDYTNMDQCKIVLFLQNCFSQLMQSWQAFYQSHEQSISSLFNILSEGSAPSRLFKNSPKRGVIINGSHEEYAVVSTCKNYGSVEVNELRDHLQFHIGNYFPFIGCLVTDALPTEFIDSIGLHEVIESLNLGVLTGSNIAHAYACYVQLSHLATKQDGSLGRMIDFCLREFDGVFRPFQKEFFDTHRVWLRRDYEQIGIEYIAFLKERLPKTDVPEIKFLG